MASDQSFVDFVVEQITGAGHIESKKMFGEYAVYCNSKVVALICDNQLFIKPTVSGRTFIGNVIEAPPYHGAKPSFLIEEGLDDSEWLTKLIKITADELPIPKPKSPKKLKRD
jgi:TfoX/Sxy family transcriptional regulator of competence genes